MRVEVDKTQCEANGMCQAIAPQIFSLDDRDEVEIIADPVPAGLEAAARDAVATCPKAALRVAR
ncbi:MAG: ferredoxin [Mycolicibacterium sp.]|nr:ferredoxin [Mycolicibacterium sp.]